MPRDREGLAALVASMSLKDPRIARAFTTVDRADHVPEALRAEAYDDRPVPLPRGQTTSQPTLIALMIDAAAPRPTDKILEVGTGFGFQTALLARLVAEVVSMDRDPGLVETARSILERNQVTNVSVYVGDGWKGHPEEAPYDAIIVSAAAAELPAALAEQLAEGGRLVVPISRSGGEDVRLFVRRDGRLVDEGSVSAARFVPLVRGDGG